MSIKECVEKGHLQRVAPDKELAEKEFREAIVDINTARKAFRSKDFKWSIVSAYYSMFHAARGFLFLNGLREKAHYAVNEALIEFIAERKLKQGLSDDFAAAMHAREAADYHYAYSKETAKQILGIAEEFVAELVTRRIRRELV